MAQEYPRRIRKGERTLPEEGERERFLFRGDQVLLRREDGKLRLPREEERKTLGALRLHHPREDRDGWEEVPPEAPLRDGWEPTDLRPLWGLFGEEVFFRAGRAFHLRHWARTTRFCGRCGTPLEDHPAERCRVCPACGQLHYPLVSPAVLVSVERDGQILLARGHHFPPGRFSVLAGFAEPGESLEGTVRREVLEEVGLEVEPLRYAGSQPWPFPHSLMVAFEARWVSGEIRLQEEEIAEADWFAPEALPELPPPLSLSRRLVDRFLARSGGPR